MSKSAQYLAWANDQDLAEERVLAAVLRPVRILDSQPLTLYWATISGRWDDDAHFFEPLLRGGLVIERKTQAITHGTSLPTYGRLSLALASGETVDEADQVTTDQIVGGDYAFYGQPISLYSGGPSLAWEHWGLLLSGYMGHPSPGSLPFYGQDEAVFKTLVPPNVFVGSV